MQQALKSFYSIMLTIILYTIVLSSISFVGVQSKKLYRGYMVSTKKQDIASEVLALQSIASLNREYSGSDVVNTISSNKEKYQYVVSINNQDYYIYRGSSDYETAKKSAQFDLKSGDLKNNYELLGDMQGLLDTRLWSTDYLINSVFKDNISKKYKATLWVKDAVDGTWSNIDKLSGETLRPTSVVGKVYQIKYTCQ